MGNLKKMNHLRAVGILLTDSADEIVEVQENICKHLGKLTSLNDKFANRRISELEILLRKLSQRCGRLADEVASMKDA